MNKAERMVVILMLCAMAAPGGVAAALLSLEFSGLVTQGNGGLFQVDDPWSVRLFANNPSDDQDGGSNGSYRIDWTGSGAISGQQFSVFADDPTSGMSIRLGNPFISTIAISVALNNFVVFDGLQLNGFGIDLYDSPTSPSVTDDSLLSTLDYHREDPIVGQAIFGFPSSGITQVVGDVREVVISTVPIPNTFFLLGLGFVLFVVFVGCDVIKRFMTMSQLVCNPRS